jgi:hypothetical protein
MQRNWLIGVLLWAHGLLHLFGFLTSWDLIEMDVFSRTPTVLPDDLPVGVLRDLGALWLLGAIAFWISGYAVVLQKRWWKGLTFGSAILSTIATLFWIHEAWPGLILNLIIFGLIIGTWRNDPHPERNTGPDLVG